MTANAVLIRAVDVRVGDWFPQPDLSWERVAWIENYEDNDRVALTFENGLAWRGRSETVVMVGREDR